MNAPLVIAKTNKWSAIKEKSEVVISNIYNLLEQRKALSLGISFGKDSNTFLVLALEALKRAVADGIEITGFYVTHSDTLVENPALSFYCKEMLESLRQYAKSENLPIEVITCEPDITSTFVYTTVGRGRLPVFPNKKSRICSIDWKVIPQQKALKAAIKKAGGRDNLISLVGTRYSESKSREKKMESRNESASVPALDGSGHWFLAPICDWEIDDVWELLMSVDVSRGEPLYKTFVEDFEWTLKLYKDGNEGICAIIVGDGGTKAACGSRFGCFTCTNIQNDSSLEAMINCESGEYKHLSGLVKFRQYLVDTQFDLRRRTIYGQSISKAGYINCRPDNYNIEMRKTLFGFMVTLDADERERAENHYEDFIAGNIERTVENERLCEPQFEFVTAAMVMAVEFAWATQSVSSQGFQASRIYYEINTMGRRYYPKPIKKEDIKKDKIPEKKWLLIGDKETQESMLGLRNPLIESLQGESGFRTIKTSSGRQRIGRVDIDRSMTIDNEKAAIFLNLEFEELYFQYQYVHAMDAIKYLLHNSFIMLSSSKLAKYHEITKRYELIRERGIYHNMSDSDLYEKLAVISNVEHEEMLNKLSNENPTHQREEGALLPPVDKISAAQVSPQNELF